VALMARIPDHPLIRAHCTRPPEWRRNPTTGEWVIMAPERAGKPDFNEPRPEAPPEPIEECPFCEGNERHTDPELLSFREAGTQPNGPGWRVRVVPNAYAAVKYPEPAAPAGVGDSFFQRASGVGRHELFIECPQHEINLTKLPVEQVREVVQAWRERLLDASRDPNLGYAQLFKNHGPDAGASVPHAHSQMIATPMIPVALHEELEFAQHYHHVHGGCVYCELLRREFVSRERVVFESTCFAVISAYAARQPFECWIVPKQHQSQLESISTAEADELGTVLWTLLGNLISVLDGPSYNLVFHSGPFHQASQPHYHWHVEVLPRLMQLAGYEWGTGAHVNPVLPEDAAAVLRETEIM
jgi:UDPglucose--hexose-1-phosphate uridylyltransferase